MSSAFVPTAQVYAVFDDNALPGVKIIVFSIHLKFPVTLGLIEKAPCVDNLFISSSKSTLIVGKVTTFTAPFDGVTDNIVGAVVSLEYAVVKLHVYVDVR